MDRRCVLAFGALLWALVGAAVALLSFRREAPTAASGPSTESTPTTRRASGFTSLVSVVTPTYFAYVLNVPALLLGLVLLVAPRAS